MARKGGRKVADFTARMVKLGAERLVRDLAATPEQAHAAMREIVHDICVEYGGTEMYIPRDMEWELSRRDLEIWEAFTGSNHTELARRFGLCERQISDIVRHVRRVEAGKRQSQLPGFDEPAT